MIKSRNQVFDPGAFRFKVMNEHQAEDAIDMLQKQDQVIVFVKHF